MNERMLRKAFDDAELKCRSRTLEKASTMDNTKHAQTAEPAKEAVHKTTVSSKLYRVLRKVHTIVTGY